MVTLAEFLLARIAEDEEAATPGEGWNTLGWDRDVPVQFWDYGEVHVGHKRFLAECEAKRAIATRASLVLESRDLVLSGKPEQAVFPDVNRRECSQARTTLYDFAAVYADHPDYRQEWKP